MEFIHLLVLLPVSMQDVVELDSSEALYVIIAKQSSEPHSKTSVSFSYTSLNNFHS